MTEDIKRNCRNCFWWTSFRENDAVLEGTCHINPPTVVVFVSQEYDGGSNSYSGIDSEAAPRQPWTRETDWCSEWHDKEEGWPTCHCQDDDGG